MLRVSWINFALLIFFETHYEYVPNHVFNLSTTNAVWEIFQRRCRIWNQVQISRPEKLCPRIAPTRCWSRTKSCIWWRDYCDQQGERKCCDCHLVAGGDAWTSFLPDEQIHLYTIVLMIVCITQCKTHSTNNPLIILLWGGTPD